VAPTSPPLSPERRAARWCRVVASLRTAQLRASYLRVELQQLSTSEAAAALERVCADKDAADPQAAWVVHALVELLADPALAEARELLRAEARAQRLFALERLLRRPFVASKTGTAATPPAGAVVEDEPALLRPEDDPPPASLPDYGRGRPLTLGERKWIARRPPPELIPRILADPHPDVIRNVLASARVTEDDVVRLVTKRPNRPEVLREVARHPRWCHRPRIRLSLVLNPATPPELAIAMAALLRRNELALVIEQSALHPALRAAAIERYERLPPIPEPDDDALQ
jgi:hypothetical protein